MNAIEDNRFVQEMKSLSNNITTPTAILMISAHWETKGTFVTYQEKPRTIHDFGGFPKELHEVEYSAPGSKWLAEQTKKTVKKTVIEYDETWGFDHGNWSVTKNIYPEANIPIIQLSIDYTKDAQYHFELAKELSKLRDKGVLIIGSGNMVHNLREVRLKGNDFNEEYGFDWAIEANEKFKELILAEKYDSLTKYKTLGKAVQKAVPTPEHYLPMIYTMALKESKDKLSFFNDELVGGSASMTSIKIETCT